MIYHGSERCSKYARTFVYFSEITARMGGFSLAARSDDQVVSG